MQILKNTLLSQKRGLWQGIEGNEEACLYYEIQQKARKHCKKNSIDRMTFSSCRHFSHSTLSPLFKATVCYFLVFQCKWSWNVSLAAHFPHFLCLTLDEDRALPQGDHRQHAACGGDGWAETPRNKLQPWSGRFCTHNETFPRSQREAPQEQKRFLLSFQKTFIRCSCKTLLSSV